jgi:threonine synthase
MTQYKGYSCSLCNAFYEPASVFYTCPKCGGNVNVVLDYEKISSKYHKEDLQMRTEDSLWKYLPLLPVSDPGGMGTPLRLSLIHISEPTRPY